EGHVEVWDAQTGEVLVRDSFPEESIRSIDVSASGRLIAVGAEDGGIELLGGPRYDHLRRFRGHEGGVLSLSFSADDRWLVSGSEDHTVRLWDPSLDAKVLMTQEHDAPIESVSFTADGRQVRSLSRSVGGSQVRVWDATTGVSLESTPRERFHYRLPARSTGA